MTWLDQVEERAKKATPGPWEYSEYGFINSEDAGVAQTWDKCEDDFVNCERNGDFIAAARTDVPELVARLQAAIVILRHNGDHETADELERPPDGIDGHSTARARSE